MVIAVKVSKQSMKGAQPHSVLAAAINTVITETLCCWLLALSAEDIFYTWHFCIASLVFCTASPCN